MRVKYTIKAVYNYTMNNYSTVIGIQHYESCRDLTEMDWIMCVNANMVRVTSIYFISSLSCAYTNYIGTISVYFKNYTGSTI